MHSHTRINKISQKNKFVLLEITETKLTKVVHSLKSQKVAGLDDTSPHLLKK
jgi:hypothetical protein